LRGIRRGEGTAVEVGDGDRCARGGAHLGTAVGTRSPAAPSPPSARAQAAALAGGVGQVLGVELASLIRQPEIVGLPLEVVQLGVEAGQEGADAVQDRKSTRLNSSHVKISYAVFCLKKKRKKKHPADVSARTNMP